MGGKPLALAALALAAVAAGAWALLGKSGQAPLVPPPASAIPAQPGEAASFAADANSRLEPAPAQPRIDVELQETSEVTGRVLDAAGAPVAGALVSCMVGDAEHAARTAADGAFVVTVPGGAGDRAWLFVHAAGHRRLRTRVASLRPQHDVGDLEVRPGAVLAGRVVDTAGRPVERAIVRRMAASAAQLFDDPAWAHIEREGGVGAQAARTDADGYFELPHVSTAAYALRIVHDDFRVGMLEGGALAPGEVRDGLVVVLDPGLSLRGRVVGLPAGIQGVSVFAQSLRLTPYRGPANVPLDFSDQVSASPPGFEKLAVGADGSFALPRLAPEDGFRIWVAHRDPAGRLVRCSDLVTAGAGQHGVVLRYDPGVTITFRLVDAETGEPVERAAVSVRLLGEGLFAKLTPPLLSSQRHRSWPDGRVTLSHVRVEDDRTLHLRVRARGYAAVVREDIGMPAAGILDLGAIALARAR